MALTEEQMLMLNNLIYLKDFSNSKNQNRSIGQILDDISDKMNSKGGYKFNNPPSDDEWKQIVQIARNDEELSGMYVCRTMDNKNSGGRAMCVTSSPSADGEHYPEGTESYVVFAGTGKNEWRDDAVAATETDSPYQEEAYEFVENLPEDLQDITVSGHSKGGNKAMYVTVRSDRVKECYAYDGEGFSQEFVDKYKEEIEKKRVNIHLRCHYRDYVNLLLISIAGDIKYYVNEQGIDKNSEKSVGEYHRPDLMFRRDKDGNIVYEMAPDGEQDFTMQFMHEFVIYLMKHAPKGELVVAMSVFGELLQKLVSGKGQVNEEILEKYGKDGAEIILKYLIAFLQEYKRENPVQFDLNFDAIYQLIMKFFGVKGVALAALIYEILKSDNLYRLAAIVQYIYNAVDGGSTIRDFSASTKERLLSMAKEVEEEKWYDVTRWDCWYRLEKSVGHLNIDYYAENINTYYRKLIDINGASCRDIEKIFDKVYEIDSRCGGKIRDSHATMEKLSQKLKSLSDSISI